MAAATFFAISVGVGVILIWASVTKLRTPAQFIAGVRGYRLLPSRLVTPVAILVLAAEATIGVLLVTTLVPAPATVMAACLFALFTAVLAISLIRKSDAPCFCFGSEQAEPISVMALVRAVLLLTLSAVAALLALGGQSSALTREEIGPALTLAAAIVVVTGLHPLRR